MTNLLDKLSQLVSLNFDERISALEEGRGGGASFEEGAIYMVPNPNFKITVRAPTDIYLKEGNYGALYTKKDTVVSYYSYLPEKTSTHEDNLRVYSSDESEEILAIETYYVLDVDRQVLSIYGAAEEYSFDVIKGAEFPPDAGEWIINDDEVEIELSYNGS